MCAFVQGTACSTNVKVALRKKDQNLDQGDNVVTEAEEKFGARNVAHLQMDMVLCYVIETVWRRVGVAR